MSKKPLIFLFYLILLLFVNGCSFSAKPFYKSNLNFKSAVDFSKLQIGDIVVTPPDINPISWFGHSAVVVSKNNIGEYPNLTLDYVETNIKLWFSEKNRYAVLRYKKFDSNFERQFLKNVAQIKDKSYGISDKTSDKKFYCSQYVWYLYWKTAEDLGYQLDLSINDEYLVLPYEFLQSKQLIQVDSSSN